MSCLVIGALNVTPDSFSDGGLYIDSESALARARELLAQGADIIDVGGESTRPGAERVTPEEEQRRVMPVVSALAAEGVVVSIDTVNASTARAALAAGASIVNDVSGGTADPLMRGVVAEAGAEFVIMHWRGIPDPGHSRSHYDDVVAEVCAGLDELARAAIAAGVPAEKLILDPGLGFDKTADQGWRLLASLDRLTALGYRVLVGASRKRMLGEALGEVQGEALGDGETLARRDLATAVVSALAEQAGAWGVRVHDVASTAAALAVSAAWRRGAADSRQKDAGDRITLTGLEVFAHHGVFDLERERGQRFIIDAEVAVDTRAAAAADDLTGTVHYGELAEAIAAATASDPVDLIETLAERIAQVALGFEGATEARITVHKPDAPIDATFADVSVTIVRSRSQGVAG